MTRPLGCGVSWGTRSVSPVSSPVLYSRRAETLSAVLHQALNDWYTVIDGPHQSWSRDGMSVTLDLGTETVQVMRGALPLEKWERAHPDLIAGWLSYVGVPVTLPVNGWVS